MTTTCPPPGPSGPPNVTLPGIGDGTVITLEPPGGGWTAVIPICPLEVAEGSTETVGIALNVRSSFLRSGSHWSFQPRFRALRDRTPEA